MEGRTAQPVFPVCMYVQVCACRHVNSTCKQCLIRQLPRLENRSWEETDEVAALSWVSKTQRHASHSVPIPRTLSHRERCHRGWGWGSKPIPVFLSAS